MPELLSELQPEHFKKGAPMAEQIASGVDKISAHVDALSGELIEARSDEELASADRTLSRIVKADEEARFDQSRIAKLGATKYVKDEATRALHGFEGYSDRFKPTPDGANDALKNAKLRIAARLYLDNSDQRKVVEDLLERTRRERYQREHGEETGEYGPPPPEVQQWLKEFKFAQVAQKVHDLKSNVAKYLPDRLGEYSITAPQDIEVWYTEVEEARYRRERFSSGTARAPDPERDLAIYWELIGEDSRT